MIPDEEVPANDMDMRSEISGPVFATNEDTADSGIGNEEDSKEQKSDGATPDLPQCGYCDVTFLYKSHLIHHMKVGTSNKMGSIQV